MAAGILTSINAIRVKSRSEIAATMHEGALTERGFPVNPVLVLADLARSARPCLSTLADFEAANSAFEPAGMREPTMSDYEQVAGIASSPQWRTDLRYEKLLSFYCGGQVADIGCGDGRLCWCYGICEPELYYAVGVGQDLIRTLSEKTGGRAHAIVGVAEATELLDSTFDLLLCSEAFEHLPNPSKALREFSRVVKPGGLVVIQSPSATRLRNLNPIHVLVTILGRIFPSVLQRNAVHENTFVKAYSHHWDFTRQDFREFVRDLPLRSVQIRGTTYRHRAAHRLSQWPFVSWFWGDLTVVLRKIEGKIEPITASIHTWPDIDTQ